MTTINIGCIFFLSLYVVYMYACIYPSTVYYHTFISECSHPLYPLSSLPCIYPSSYLSICPSTYASINPFTRLSHHSSIHTFSHLSRFPSIYPFTSFILPPPILLFIQSSIHPCIIPFTYPSNLFIHPPTFYPFTNPYACITNTIRENNIVNFPT